MRGTIFEAGQHIGGYVIDQPIARGGMAHIYRAVEPVTNREVALKIVSLASTFSSDEDVETANRFRQQFAAEARIIASLEHLHIVPLFHYDILCDAPFDAHLHANCAAYFAMRLMRGGSLAGLIKRGSFTFSRVFMLFDQIADGLTYAHQHGVIHCDLKPSNILLDEDGNAYLADFGLATLLKPISEKESIYEGGHMFIAGTPSYLAPEQISGGLVDERTDIYGLGLILYELLTGQPAFPPNGSDLAAMLYRQLRQPPTPPSAINPTIPRALDAIVLRALEKESGLRYKSVIEMREALHHALATITSEMARPSQNGDTLSDVSRGKRITRETSIKTKTATHEQTAVTLVAQPEDPAVHAHTPVHITQLAELTPVTTTGFPTTVNFPSPSNSAGFGGSSVITQPETESGRVLHKPSPGFMNRIRPFALGFVVLILMSSLARSWIDGRKETGGFPETNTFAISFDRLTTPQPTILAGILGETGAAIPIVDEMNRAHEVLGSEGFIAYITCASDTAATRTNSAQFTALAENSQMPLRIFDGERDHNRQITQIENARLHGARAIILCVLDHNLVQDAVTSAVEAGVPVVTVSNRRMPGTVNIRINNYAIGYALGIEAGEYLNLERNGLGRVMLLGFSTSEIATTRLRGMQDGILRAAPHAQVIATVDGGNEEDAQTAVADFIERGTTFDVILTYTDANALGAVRALADADIPPESVDVFTLGGDTTTQVYIRTGYYIRAAIDTSRGQVVQCAFDAVIKLLGSGTVPEIINIGAGEVYRTTPLYESSPP